jgi:hypothetical protein
VTDAPETGDRPAAPDSKPILVDTSRDPAVPEPQGDEVVADTVSLVRDDARPMPTAGDYRALGYGVPDHGDGPVPDDQMPGLVYADQRTEDTVHLVDTPVDLPPRPPEQAAEPDPPDPEAVSAEEQGVTAAKDGQPRTSNPHDRRTTKGKAWDKGWASAQPDA